MPFELRFDTDNAAFAGEEEGGDALLESARILRDVADRLQQGDDNGRIQDVNGNGIGKFEFK